MDDNDLIEFDDESSFEDAEESPQEEILDSPAITSNTDSSGSNSTFGNGFGALRNGYNSGRRNQNNNSLGSFGRRPFNRPVSRPNSASQIEKKEGNDAEQPQVDNKETPKQTNGLSKITNGLSKASDIKQALNDPKGAAKEVAKEYAKKTFFTMIKPFIPYILIGAGILIAVLTIVILVVVIAGDLDFEDSTSYNYESISTKYAYCESVNVAGNLYSLDDYVAGVVQHEAYTSEGEEALKAQAIAARTYVLYYTDGCKKSIANSQSTQTFATNPDERAKKAAYDTTGLVLYYNDNIFKSEYDAFCYVDEDCPDSTKNADGSYTVTYKKEPTYETHKITLTYEKYYNIVEDKNIKGHGHGRGMSQYVSYQLAKEGMNFEQILKYFYSPGVAIVSLNKTVDSNPGSENSNSGNGYKSTYTNLKSGKTYYNYKQCDFDNDWLCSFGCGLTSTSIIISSNNKNITPSYLYNNYRAPLGYVSMSSYLSNYLSSNYKKSNGTVKKIKTELINHLERGGTAIFFIEASRSCNVMNGVRWTNSQHYFVVLDYNSSNNTIYISNPGSNSNAKNGWISLDEFDCAEVAFLVE